MRFPDSTIAVGQDSGSFWQIAVKGVRRRLRIRSRLRLVRVSASSLSWSLVGSILNNGVRAYWWKDTTNFGDLLTPLLLKTYGLTPVHSTPGRSNVVAAGSILEVVPEDYSGCIVGSGLMTDVTRRFRNATVLAVRGELSRQRIGASSSVVLGDPGLLASRLLMKRQKKCYLLGVVPHYVDKTDPRVLRIRDRYKRDTLVIDVERRPLAVLTDIDKCEYILSSSLHGIVAADSLGIPNAWVVLSDKVVGRGFKYYDYYSALGMRWEPLHFSGDERLSDLLKRTRRPPAVTGEVKERLHDVFRQLRQVLGIH